MPDPSPPDDAIDPLLAQVLEAPEARWPEVVEALCTAHPGQAAALRRRFRSLQRFGLALPPPPPRPGGSLGPFELGRVLGAGAMGVVYCARDTRDGAEVALKLLRQECVASAAATRRLRQEGEALGRLQHPNLCRLREVGETDGVPYLAMELLRGESLATHLERARLGIAAAAPWQQSVLVLEKVARGLAAAHASGVVHRDVKPGNIMLRADGEPVLFDFGLAALADAATLTRTGTALGTPAYMPPEQVRGEGEITPRADVWALGAVLFECLALHPPFVAQEREQTYRKILTEEPPSLRRANPRVPRALAHIVHSCLEKDPRRRYADAGELALDLERLRTGKRVSARPPAPWRLLARTARRHPLAAVATLAAAALLAAGARIVAVESRAARAADRALASAVEELAQGDPVVAALLAREAFEKAPGHATRSRLVATLAELHQMDEVRTGGGASWAQTSPDGSTLLCTVYPSQDPLPEPQCVGGTWRRVVQLPGYTAAWSPDGLRFAIGRTNAAPELYDAATGTLLEKRPGKGKLPGFGRISQHMPHLAFAPDGTLFWGAMDGGVRGFSPDGHGFSLHRHSAPVCALFTTAGGVVSVGRDGTVVRSSPDGTPSVQVHAAGQVCDGAVLSGDGRWLALALHDGALRRLRVDGAPAVVATLAAAAPRSCLAIDHDGGRILIGRVDQSLSLWLPGSSDTGEIVNREDTVPTAAAFAPPGAPGGRAFAAAYFAGHLVVFGGDRRVTDVLRGHRDVARFIRFSVHGDEVLSASPDRSVRRWRLDVPGFASLRGGAGAVWAARWLPDGQHIAAAVAPAQLVVWDREGRQRAEQPLEWEQAEKTGGMLRLAIAPAGAGVAATVAIAGETLIPRRFAWDRAAPFTLTDMPLAPGVRRSALGLCCVPSGSLWLGTQEHTLVEVAVDGSVRGEPRRLPSQPWAVVVDGPSVFVTDLTHLLTFGTMASTTTQVELPSPAHSIAVLDTHHLVTGHLDGAVRILRKDGHVVHTWMLHGSRVTGVDVAPGGDRIASAGADGRARVLTRDGGVLLDLPHSPIVFTAAFSPDGRSVVTAGSNRVARVWPVTDEEICRLARVLPFRALTPEERARIEVLSPR